MQKNTQKLIIAALLTALSIVLTREVPLSQFVLFGATFRLNLGMIPIFLSSLLLGPLYGGATGLLADTLGYVVNPMGGVFIPGIALTSTLCGVMPWLFSRVGKENSAVKYFSLVLSYVIATTMNTAWLSLMQQSPFFPILAVRIIPALLLSWVYSAVILALELRLKKEIT